MRKRVVITDENLKELAPAGFQIVVPPGESSKTREWKARIEDQMLEAGFGRDCQIIAFGGGVINDLAGFVAATYCRGVAWIAIPTTLLAMVDASIGGKVAVNAPLGKNMIGAFHPPEEVIVDFNLLKSLPEREWKNGVAEIIKYGLIKDPSLLEAPRSLKAIKRSIAIKKEIVAADPKEKGLRRILNFGHTVGHALEQLSDYQLSHGEAVAMGMRVATRMSGLRKEEIARVEACLDREGFEEIPLSEKILEVIKLDKKARNGLPRFVLLEEIGKVRSFAGEYCREIKSEELLCAFQKVV